MVVVVAVTLEVAAVGVAVDKSSRSPPCTRELMLDDRKHGWQLGEVVILYNHRLFSR